MEEGEEVISVIIPTFNRASTIKRSIESVLNQTYKELEVIVIDDNSNDNTREIVENISDSRLRYIRHDKNYGANVARNTGVNNAKGSLIAFQDSDDEWLENKLEIQLKEMEIHNADIVSCAINKFIGEEKSIIPNRIIEDSKIEKEILYGNFISGQTILGKKECFLKESFDNKLPRLQEWELVIRLSKRYKIHFVNKALVNVYLQQDSISVNPEKAIIALKYIMNKHKELIINDNKAAITLYKMLGNYSMELGVYEQNYYYKALKYDRFNFKLYIKGLIYVIRKYINKIR